MPGSRTTVSLPGVPGKPKKAASSKIIDTIRLIIFGDVVARIGRAAVAEVLSAWKKTYEPHAVIANVENLTHGRGITEKSLRELSAAGISVFTGGNHVWSKEDPANPELVSAFPLALPANDPRTIDAQRVQTLTIGGQKLFVLNLLGQVFMHEEGTENPFHTFDKLYETLQRPKLLLVDLHAEATSEKVAFGFHVEGRASLVYGTHTHVPTADARVLPQGTGYVSDVGMTGSDESVLGVSKDVIISRFLGTAKVPFEYPETGAAQVNALYCELDMKTGKVTTLKQLHKKLTIK